MRLGRLWLRNVGTGNVLDNVLVAPVMVVSVNEVRPLGALTPLGELFSFGVVVALHLHL